MCTVRPAVIALFPLSAILASADFASAQQPSAEGNGRRTMAAMRLLDFVQSSTPVASERHHAGRIHHVQRS
jgi:hypothetical protein